MRAVRAYRWGEDGIGGFCDDHQRWCLSVALWNGRDPILKERLFGLTNAEGNHGEDVKELYYFLDGTPTHSYMRMLYKYPQAAFPYEWLRRGEPPPRPGQTRIRDRRYRRVRRRPLFRCDRGIREGLARRHPDAHHGREPRGRTGEPARAADVLGAQHVDMDGGRGAAAAARTCRTATRVRGELRRSASRCTLHVGQPSSLLFCENETNTRRLYGSQDAGTFKDGINDFLVHGDGHAVSPLHEGTKCAALSRLDLPADGRAVLRLRLRPAAIGGDAFQDFDQIFASRIEEADAFYGALQAGIASADARLVQRQALAGMLWSKQFYCYDVSRWLKGDPTAAGAARRAAQRAQSRMEAPQQRRHHLDAGHMGVSLVRGLGSGVSLRHLRADRPGVRQVAARAALPRMVHASERPIPGLRVGVRRRQSAGPRLGGLARLSDGQGAHRDGRPRLSSNACSTS